MKEHSWWVYMVRCADGSLYTGMAADVDKRIAVHNSGQGAKYTKSRLPVEAVYREECDSKSQALKREAAIKKFTRSQKLELLDAQDCERYFRLMPNVARVTSRDKSPYSIEQEHN